MITLSAVVGLCEITASANLAQPAAALDKKSYILGNLEMGIIIDSGFKRSNV